jgi:predicted ATPase with chaperone activity
MPELLDMSMIVSVAGDIEGDTFTPERPFRALHYSVHIEGPAAMAADLILPPPPEGSRMIAAGIAHAATPSPRVMPR